MKTINDIIHHIKTTNIVEKTIYVNLIVYLIIVFIPLLDMVSLFSLPAALDDMVERPWTLFTYSVIHVRFIHLLSNLIVLYYIGNLFLNFFSPKQFLIYYVLGLVVGGVFFVAFYEISTQSSLFPLGGASAAVMAIIVGLAVKIPHYSLKLRFIGSVELWVLAAIWVAISAFGAAGVNAGTGVAHLGGAFIGFVLTLYLNEANMFAVIFKRRPQKTPFTKVYKNKKTVKTKPSSSKKMQNQRKVDAILGKISKSGYDALTQSEKDFLFNQKED